MWFFCYFCRSVVVVCRNMNATDLERLVPHLGCQPDKASKNSTSTSHKGRCIELLQPQQRLPGQISAGGTSR